MRKSVGLLAVMAAAAMALSACALEGSPRPGSEPSGPVIVNPMPIGPVRALPPNSFTPAPVSLLGHWTAVEVLGVKEPKTEPSAVQFYGTDRARAVPDSWADNTAYDGCFWATMYPVFGPGAKVRIGTEKATSPFCEAQHARLNKLLNQARWWGLSSRGSTSLLTIFDAKHKRLGLFVLDEPAAPEPGPPVVQPR
jgi:hypothetical protein